MNLIPAPFDVLPRLLVRGTTRRVYYAQQAAIRYSLLASHIALRTLSGQRIEPPAEAVEALRREYERLLEQDLRNVERDLYPASLLFQLPLAAYARKLPSFLLDLPRVYGRSRSGDFKNVPEIEGRSFPAYFWCKGCARTSVNHHPDCSPYGEARGGPRVIERYRWDR